MTRLTYLYRYRLNKKDLEHTVKEISERSGDDDDLREEFKNDIRDMIKDFLDKFYVFYTDDDRDFLRNDSKKAFHRDYYRNTYHAYEITITPKDDKRKRFSTYIGLPSIPFDNRTSLDLGYIIDALSWSAVMGSDVGEMSEEQEKKKNEESNRLYEFISSLNCPDSFWIDILNGSL